MTWEMVARAVEESTGTFVDWDEEYFICPECGEPVYKCDWQESDYTLGQGFNGEYWCPICDMVLIGEGEDYE